MAATPVGVKRFYAVLAVVAVAGLGILGWLMAGRKDVSIPANVTVQPADTAGFRGYLLGSETAPVEVTEYADYECPGCQSFETVQFPDVRERLINTGRIRWRYRDLPLEQHPNARLAAHAAACADDQRKFWEMHRFIYEGQRDWAGRRDAADTFRSYARSAGLDLGPYDTCMKSAKHAGRIQASYQEAQAVGAASTPTFQIGGRLYPGLTYDQMKRIVDSIAPASAAATP